MMLHAIIHFMGVLVTFTKESAIQISETIEVFGSKIPMSQPFLSSRILNRQIKIAMNMLKQDVTNSVLVELERTMKTRTRDNWGPSFCTILILSLCIENLQTAADTLVVTDIRKSLSDNLQPNFSRAQSSRACQNLERYPYQKFTELFHAIYKSSKDSNSGGKDKGFNPICNRAVRDELDEPTKVLVQTIENIMDVTSKNSLLILSQNMWT
jgi:hypothetical protein